MAKDRTPKNPAFPIEWDEAQKLIDGLFRHGKNRHAAYVKLATTLGLRYSDTSRITWGQILDSKTGVFQSTEKKTGKVARRTISTDLVEFIAACYQSENCPPKDQPILTSQKGGKIVSIQSMNMTAKGKWIDLYDLKIEPRNFSQHSFRKTSAMRVYDLHGIVQAQNWLNHASATETAKYLLLNEKQKLAITL